MRAKGVEEVKGENDRAGGTPPWRQTRAVLLARRDLSSSSPCHHAARYLSLHS